jgi:hypothetical protein
VDLEEDAMRNHLQIHCVRTSKAIQYGVHKTRSVLIGCLLKRGKQDFHGTMARRGGGIAGRRRGRKADKLEPKWIYRTQQELTLTMQVIMGWWGHAKRIE